MPSQPGAELAARLSYLFSQVNEQIGYLQSPVVLSRVAGGAASRPVRLWDTHIRLRTNLSVSIHVGQGAVVGGWVRHSLGGGTVLEWGEHETQSVNGNPDMPRLLRQALAELIEKGTGRGLRLRARPLIAATLWADGTRRDICSVEALGALNVAKRTILLGPPGSGKSTVVRALAVCHLGPLMEPRLAESPEHLGLWDAVPLTPIYVELKELVGWDRFPNIGDKVTADNLLEFVRTQYYRGDEELSARLVYDLQESRALVILDGLDEVPIPYDIPDALERRRGQIQELMRSMSIRFPRTKLIVTSRPAGYSDWTLEGFDVVRLMPLDDVETMDLVSRLYRALGRHDAATPDVLSQFQNELRRVPRALREQPLFLTLLALLFLDRRSALPQQRGALLQASLNLLLTTWTLPRAGAESVQDVLHCSEEQLYERLESLAFRAQTEFAASSPTLQAATEPHLSLGAILEELFELGEHVNIAKALEFLSNQAGILVSPAPRVYRFAHRMFQEYLAASYISHQSGASAMLRRLLEEDQITWQEPTLLLGDIFHNTGRILDLWEVISELVAAAGVVNAEDTCHSERLAWLAGRVAAEQRIESSESVAADRIRRNLGSALRQIIDPRRGLDALGRVEAAEALASLTDDRAGIGMRDGLPDVAWCELPGGTFLMGTLHDDPFVRRLIGRGMWDLTREAPQHEVTTMPYCLARYPVTIAQYQSFVEAADGFRDDRWWSNAGKAWRDSSSPAARPEGRTANCPQVGVTWFEAAAFCKWFSDRSGMTIRLPSEAEWEKAARGVDGRTFPWGSEPNGNLANVAESGVGRVSPVGCFSFSEGPWGERTPADMIGNVWEWCSSAMQALGGEIMSYPYDAADGREDSELGDEWLRATRGGYYGNVPVVARCAYRGRDVPSARLGRQGFRLAKSVSND